MFDLTSVNHIEEWMVNEINQSLPCMIKAFVCEQNEEMTSFLPTGSRILKDDEIEGLYHVFQPLNKGNSFRMFAIWQGPRASEVKRI